MNYKQTKTKSSTNNNNNNDCSSSNNNNNNNNNNENQRRMRLTIETIVPSSALMVAVIFLVGVSRICKLPAMSITT